MTTLYDFGLKIETSWAKKDVKCSSETWNVNDVIVYVWYVYSQIKLEEKTLQPMKSAFWEKWS